MKIEIIIDVDTDRKDSVRICSTLPPDPTRDLAVMMEGVGCIASVMMKQEGISAAGMKMILSKFLDKVLNENDERAEMVEQVEA